MIYYSQFWIGIFMVLVSLSPSSSLLLCLRLRLASHLSTPLVLCLSSRLPYFSLYMY
jgi:hypothetical protein